MEFVWIAISGAAGTLTRYSIWRAFPAEPFPFATAIVNVVGCLLIGIVLGNTLRTGQGATSAQVIIAVGFLGGFTTFSAFSMEVVRLFAHQRIGLAIAYAALSPLLCVVAAGVGVKLSALIR